MTTTLKTRHWVILLGAAAAALVFVALAERGGGKRVVVADEPPPAPSRALERAPEPDRERPSVEELAARFPGREPHERRDAPVVNGVVQIGPRGSGKSAAPAPATSRQTGAAWVTSYAVAMCECQTRSCAASLQGSFIRSMGGVDYDEARDGAAYHEASKKAVDCYLALPEGT